ncbi:hypothetical protein C8J56DRAFT_885847 [Mycena floridula]|nr:hypothetical protein C8J56DRAFT_885847 [Mycena floridula]
MYISFIKYSSWAQSRATAGSYLKFTFKIGTVTGKTVILLEMPKRKGGMFPTLSAGTSVSSLALPPFRWFGKIRLNNMNSSVPLSLTSILFFMQVSTHSDRDLATGTMIIYRHESQSHLSASHNIFAALSFCLPVLCTSLFDITKQVNFRPASESPHFKLFGGQHVDSTDVRGSLTVMLVFNHEYPDNIVFNPPDCSVSLLACILFSGTDYHVFFVAIVFD